MRAAAAYDARAAEYAQLLGTMEATSPEDRRLVEAWAAEAEGPLLDLGCGPGHWTAHLAGRGHDILGMDPAPAFLAHARQAHPQVRFEDGGLEDLDPGRRRWGGILAWYSLIHRDPGQLPGDLALLRACLRPSGELLIGFFDAAEAGCGESEPFDHAITTAHRWPAAMMAELLAQAGLAVEHVERRTDPGVRPHAAIRARRMGR
ncbi:class I SAM-dependent methyltransferase [Brachybacterium hainanense]|uniref:Class I SAM-dependent methyltransferase n=1 Tax=Brachybacterium hainanense TaxID=1541174 RepID=A0ABV6R9M6_9MICO